MRVKGDAPSVWVWILASFIFASLIVAVFWNAAGSFKENVIKEKQQKLLEELGKRANNFCEYPEGSREEWEIEAVGPLLLTAGEGEICGKGKIEQCMKIKCKVNMTTLAIPEGVDEEYRFTIEKGNATVYIRSELP